MSKYKNKKMLRKTLFMTRPTRVTIDLDSLRSNYRLIKQNVGGNLLAVLKANAYGHGITRCGKALRNEADGFAVSCLEEAISLRNAGLHQTILLLAGFFSWEELELIDQYSLDIVVHQQYQIDLLEVYPLKKTVRVWLKMDSGMGRLGFLPISYRQAWMRLKQIRGIREIVKMTHLACANLPNHEGTLLQLKKFENYTLGLKGESSIANSAALINYTDTHAEWNRSGLLLYGVNPVEASLKESLPLKPVMTVTSSIIGIKQINIGNGVGYGTTWIAKRPTKLGVVAIGYADGYPLHANDKSHVLVHKTCVPLVGRVSMDMLIVDLTDVASAKIGDDVIIWGKDLPVTTVAKSADTIPYQLLCHLNRVAVSYIDSDVEESLSCTQNYIEKVA